VGQSPWPRETIVYLVGDGYPSAGILRAGLGLTISPAILESGSGRIQSGISFPFVLPERRDLPDLVTGIGVPILGTFRGGAGELASLAEFDLTDEEIAALIIVLSHYN